MIAALAMTRPRSESRVRHILAVPPGDCRRDRDDGGPAGEFLHDRVEPGVLQGQFVSKTVVIMSRSDSVHSARGSRGRRGRRTSCRFDGVAAFGAATHDRVDHLTHRQHDAPQLHELLAHPVGVTLDLRVNRPVVEQTVLECLDGVIEILNGLETGRRRSRRAGRAAAPDCRAATGRCCRPSGGPPPRRRKPVAAARFRGALSRCRRAARRWTPVR